jgi:ubiquinone/menaquinone biosynthesis C-methylase UbiE
MSTWVRFTQRSIQQVIALLHLLRGRRAASSSYRLLDGASVPDHASTAWHDRVVALRQDEAYRSLLRDMHAGRPRVDLRVAAEAVYRTGVTNPSVLEVGCGSGYYSEVLRCLLPYPVHYLGLDYSAAMIDLARKRYPSEEFVVGDATALPFADSTFDIVFNGVSLMHIPRYEAAISESRRVTRRWCIFHTVPVLKHRRTTFLR